MVPIATEWGDFHVIEILRSQMVVSYCYFWGHDSHLNNNKKTGRELRLSKQHKLSVFVDLRLFYVCTKCTECLVLFIES